MHHLKTVLPLLLLMVCHQSHAQLDIFANPRVSFFEGKFGKEYTGIGFELGFTAQPDPEKPWAGGIHYHGNFLGMVDGTPFSPEMNVFLNTFSAHFGGKRTIHRFFHPYAYAVAGLRVLSFKDTELEADDEAFFDTFTFTYGLKTGLQLGAKQWRVELKLDYLRGSTSRYLVEETFLDAYEANKGFRDFTRRSTMNNLSPGIGVVYVFGDNDYVIQ